MGIFSETAPEVTGAVLGSVSPFAIPLRDTVLLVEDDDSVAGLLGRILASLPLRVVRTRTGTEAESFAASKSCEIAIAIIDCGLPDTDGRPLARRLRRVAARMPVLLTSGSDTVVECDLNNDGPTAFLPKPFFPSEVRGKVRALVSTIA